MLPTCISRMVGPLSIAPCRRTGRRVTITGAIYSMIFYVHCPLLTTENRTSSPCERGCVSAPRTTNLDSATYSGRLRNPARHLTSRRIMRLALTLITLVYLLSTTVAGTIDTVAGTGKEGYAGDGDKATAALLNQPFHCELDGKGNLYVAEAFNHCIRKIDLKTGVI